MKQRLFIFLGLIFLVVLLVGLNAASFARKEVVPDNEYNPNRSTYNGGATGTRAFYDLLNETGRKAVRWQQPMASLAASDSKNKPATFVIIGQTRGEINEKETEQILRWVSAGGRLVVIDRVPPADLLKTTANWKISAVPEIEPALFGVDPSNSKQMTENIRAAKPSQPTALTKSVNAVQPSRFASGIKFEHLPDAEAPANLAPPPSAAATETPLNEENDYYGDAANSAEKQEIISETESAEDSASEIETVAPNAPVAHLADRQKNLLVDFPYGAGEIVFLADPYIVSNGGINLVDNAQLAINVVASGGGLIAFDEYHQGFGAGENKLLAYFAGTPVVPIFLQLVAVAAFVLFSQSRRFARPLPANEPNRLSKLEYVAAMAELQRRTKAYDLAIENIYADFRRRAARFLGVDNFAVSLDDLAQMIAERAKLNASETKNLMFQCEEIIRGEPTNKRQILELTNRLREIESKLGIKRTRAARK